MSASLADQLQAATASIQADLANQTAAVGAVSAEVKALQDQVASLQAATPVGSTITQDMVDQLNAVATGLAAQNDALNAIATPTPQPTPAPTPVP